jgi:hypothetical protein
MLNFFFKADIQQALLTITEYICIEELPVKDLESKDLTLGNLTPTFLHKPQKLLFFTELFILRAGGDLTFLKW